MFTGLVETVGKVRRASGDSPRRLTIESSLPLAEIAIGDSIAIDGCCLTVVEKGNDGVTFEAATETLRRTTLGALKAGEPVNLERALRLGDRLGGHLVSGHVDGLGVVTSREQVESALYLGIEAPADIAPLIASQGSICVAGVSLTVTKVEGRTFWVGLIPHTLAVTTLERVKVSGRVNLEADLIARYVQRLMSFGPTLQEASPKEASLTAEFLKDKGFL
jgi:riboflavin synthase